MFLPFVAFASLRLAGAQWFLALRCCRAPWKFILVEFERSKNGILAMTTGTTATKPKASPKPQTPDQNWERDGDQIGTLVRMFGYLWPANQPRLRFLLILTVAAMGIGQLVLFATPILFSKIIDAFQFGALGLGFWDLLWADSDQLAADAKAQGLGIEVIGGSLALVLGMVFAYGLARHCWGKLSTKGEMPCSSVWGKTPSAPLRLKPSATYTA